MKEKLRVTVAARSASGRAAAAELLAGVEEIELVAAVSAGPGVEGLPCDVVLYLLEPGESPVSVASVSTPPVLFVSSNGGQALSPQRPDNRELPMDAKLSIVPRRCSRRELAAALSAVAVGLTVRRPEMASPPPGVRIPRVNRGGAVTVHGDWGAQAGDRLTARERQVLVMIAEGLANKTIAAELGITSHTVKFHIASIMQKLGAASRTEAVTVGLRRGIILL